jgi:hypothetical protein
VAQVGGKDVNAAVDRTRTIFIPRKQYSVVVDSIDSSAAHDLGLLFHLSGMPTTPSTDAAPGKVLGSLSLGGAAVAWNQAVTSELLSETK